MSTPYDDYLLTPPIEVDEAWTIGLTGILAPIDVLLAIAPLWIYCNKVGFFYLTIFVTSLSLSCIRFILSFYS